MLIKVKVFPSAGKKEIIQKSKDDFEIWVKAKPVQGQATQAVIRVLSDFFEISAKNIKLVKGGKTRNKIFKISA